MIKKFKKVIFLSTFLLISIFTLIDATLVENRHESHVICTLYKEPKNRLQHQKWNGAIFAAVKDLKSIVEAKYQSHYKKSDHYKHKDDTVFFIDFNFFLGHFTLHCPSYINYENFIFEAGKIFKKYKLPIRFSQDSKISITNNETSYEGASFSLKDFTHYSQMDDDDFQKQINDLQDKSLTDHDSKTDFVGKIHDLEMARKMKKLFFWHLETPLTGLLPTKTFSIDESFIPLSWKYSLWELAPKQGEGVQVFVIDTGVAAFETVDKDFEKVYKKNINLSMPPQSLDHYGYNLISENGLDPIQQIAVNFFQYCDPHKSDMHELLFNLPVWIKEFVSSGNIVQIEKFFIKSAKNTLLSDDKGSLNEEGRRAFKIILHGEYGIAPKSEKPFFDVVSLTSPYSSQALLQTIPMPKINSSQSTFDAGHGTFTYGVINGKQVSQQGVIGIAPEANTFMIKAFDDNGATTKTTLNAALQKTLMMSGSSPSVVSMSLKVTDSIDLHDDVDNTLKRLIDATDYVVAASGNNGDAQYPHYAGLKEAYPARFDSVAFDVGAFGYDDGKYPVCSFTQREPRIGPKFAAPGFNIFSSGLIPSQTEESMYLFMAGTSVAVPVVTGFVALALAEFHDTFSKEQLLKVIYRSAIKMNNSRDWQKDILLGAIDMRSSLLCLHVLKYIKTLVSSNELKYAFDKKFNNLVAAIHAVIFYQPTCYGRKLGVDFSKNFTGYVKAVETIKVKKTNFYSPELTDSMEFSGDRVQDGVNFIAELLCRAIDDKKYHSVEIDKELLQTLRDILLKDIDLFKHLSEEANQRINAALQQKNNKSYWNYQKNSLKKSHDSLLA